MDTVGVEFLKGLLEPACDGLHDIFDEAHGRASRIRADNGLSASYYGSLGADLVRGLSHHAIDVAGALGGWELAGDHSKRGQLMLRNDMVRLRFLHDSAGIVPNAGSNAARRAYYRNVSVSPESLYDARASNLIAVWRVVDEETGRVQFRVVRPLSPESKRAPRGSVDVDLDFVLPRTAEALADLEFQAQDEGLQITWPDEEEETGDADGDAASGDRG
jgi:hypothetical protein